MFALALATAHAAYLLSLSCWLQTYHTAADRLQLIPVTAKYAGGVQFEIQLDRAGATASDIINADLKVTNRLPCLHHPLTADAIMLFAVIASDATRFAVIAFAATKFAVNTTGFSKQSCCCCCQGPPRLSCVVQRSSVSLLLPCTCHRLQFLCSLLIYCHAWQANQHLCVQINPSETFQRTHVTLLRQDTTHQLSLLRPEMQHGP